ncbi:MAG: PP2C family protein-serine/threonine phosphatase [Candidatus Eisenbacteria bacterium]
MNTSEAIRPMARKARPATPLSGLVAILWRGVFFAIPFALFFGLLTGGGWAALPSIYAVSLVFTYCNALASWVVRWFVRPGLEGSAGAGSPTARGKAILLDVTAYAGAAIAASMLAAGIIHFTIFPGFLGSARQFAIVALFSLLFAALFIGVAYAYHFYEDALLRARSEEELNLARRIQRSFLLSQFPSLPGVEVHALNVSSKQVSGDFYDVVPAGDRAFLVCVADVSGKGVPAALLGSMLQASLRTQAPIAASVGSIVENVNSLLCGGVANGQFATMFLARMDEATMTMSYVNAGHNHPVLVRANGTRELLAKGGPMVGSFAHVPFEEGRVTLAPGDRVVMYTDGLSEAMDARRQMYGDDRLVDLAASLPNGQTARESTDAIMGALAQFLDGEEPQDDMTLLVLRVLGPAGGRPPRAAAALPASSTQEEVR